MSDLLYQKMMDGLHPKIKQKIELLKLNKDFNHQVCLLRKTWKGLIRDYKLAEKKLIDRGRKLIKKYGISFYDTLEANNKEDFLSHMSMFKKMTDIPLNKIFVRDIENLANKFNLFPIDVWLSPLVFFVIDNEFIFPTHFLTFSGYKYGFKNNTDSKNLNFSLNIQENLETKDLELILNVFEDTSFSDIKKHWPLIKKYQDKIKKIKGIKRKRYYPLKNLELAKDLQKLDKKEKSDWIKQEKIYGELGDLYFGEEERRRKNKVKQIRYQYKKRGIK